MRTCLNVIMLGVMFVNSIVTVVHADDEVTQVELQRIRIKLAQHEQKLNAIQKRLAAGGGFVVDIEADDQAEANPEDALPSERFRPLYSINRDGTDLKFLLAAPEMVTTGTPQWSHDGNSIVVDSTPETDQVILSQIWVYGVAGPFRGMTRHLGSGNTPTWSPDDSQIAYMVNPGNPDGVEGGTWIMNADGTEKHRFGHGWYTRWSPDGTEICVYDYQTNPHSLLIYELETGNQRRVLGDDIEVVFGGATWSADGEQLVTLVIRDGEQQLITINRAGDRDSIRVICREPLEDRMFVGPPVISPDGSEIVFAIQDDVNRDFARRDWQKTYLYLVSTEESSEPRLLEKTKTGLINRSMEWSPDGQKIIFSSER